MAIPGKKRYTLFLDEGNMEYLRKHFAHAKNSGGVSALVDKYLSRCVFMHKENKDIFDNIEPGKMTFKKFLQFVKLQIRFQDDWKGQPNDPE
jgi:hypothetical protein